jgi:ribosome modulation factor
MKKDPNYIAKIEQAIQKKYGKEAIQHPKANWDDEKEKEYLLQLKEFVDKQRQKKDKVEKVEKDGFLVSKKLLNKTSDRTCPVCETYSFSTKDDIYMNKYDCCFECYVQHVEEREERWLEGWRPNK